MLGINEQLYFIQQGISNMLHVEFYNGWLNSSGIQLYSKYKQGNGQT